MKFLFVLFAVLAPLAQAPTTPRQAVDELLAADRAFSAAAGTTKSVVDGLTPMFAADVIVPQPGGKFTHGVNEIVAALMVNPDNGAGSHVVWTPVRAGISADATQGFTFGYMELHKPDGLRTPMKYMSYWVKTPSGWRVAVFKRALREDGALPDALMPPSLPAALVGPNPGAVAAAETSLAAAEKLFSDDSQKIGLGPAFAKYGAADAVNMGPAAPFLVGNDNIAAFIGKARPEPTSPVHWAADEKVIAASSGDLGISIGLIRRNAPLADGSMPPPSAFFTIWRKTNGVWKYIAE